ncbi:MAG: serine protease [Pseudomonadota bacterium]
MNFHKLPIRLILTCAAASGASSAYALDPDKIFDMVSHSIVTIVAPLSQRSYNQGSGVVIAPETVVTNCHVLQKAKSISVKHGHEVLQAKLEYPDVERDLCQIKVPYLKAPPVKIAPATSLRIGQRVYALGNPEGLELTFSEGLFSALRGAEGSQLMQISATITHGSSGGGLFDDQGRLVGITSSVFKDGGLGLNFAIPADYIADLPKRGNEALASLRNSTGTVKAGANADPSTALYPGTHDGTSRRKLNRDEILAQFTEGREFQANEQSKPFTLKILKNGSWVRRDCPVCHVSSGDGRLRVEADAGKVCFDWNFVTYPDSGCYQVYQTSPAAYFLESLEGGRPIAYRVIN